MVVLAVLIQLNVSWFGAGHGFLCYLEYAVVCAAKVRRGRGGRRCAVPCHSENWFRCV